MKKFSAVLVIMLLVVTLSACSTFNDYQTYYLAEESPQTANIVVQFNLGADAEKFAELKAAINQIIATTAEDEPLPHITAAEWDSDESTPALTLTLANVPDQVITIDTKPFRIVRTQTVFNPISLLPESEDFTYYVGFTATRRHSQVSTEHLEMQADGSYLYVWDNGNDIVFTDNYPNPPLYYILAALATMVMGVAVYFVSRYFYCKKQNKPL